VRRTTIGADPTDNGCAPPLMDPVLRTSPVNQSTSVGNGGSSSAALSPQLKLSGPFENQGACITLVGQAGGVALSVSNPPDPADDIFREALERHKLGLSDVQKQAFHGASAIKLMDIVQELNQQHNKESLTRRSAMKVQRFLEVTDGYLTLLGIFSQFNPEISSIVVGGLKLFVDVR
jgi:hypothetical protein